jgi:hypothetical protein
MNREVVGTEVSITVAEHITAIFPLVFYSKSLFWGWIQIIVDHYQATFDSTVQAPTPATASAPLSASARARARAGVRAIVEIKVEIKPDVSNTVTGLLVIFAAVVVTLVMLDGIR